ncbi:MAG: hypothetical protein U1F43_21260 [Myxococcota bacterium]
MSWSRRVVRALLLMGCLASFAPTFAPTALAAAPDDPEVAAENLHKQALDAFKKGDRATAISLWLRANTFHPFWKYAYNLANAYYQDRDYITGWRYLSEAKQTMKEHLEMLGTLEANLSVELAKTHAWLEISVLPAEAVVLKNNEAWLAPRALWTTDAHATLAISAAGYEPLTKELDLAAGARVVETYVLVPLKKGELVVTGEPAGATVSVRRLGDAAPAPGAPPAAPSDPAAGGASDVPVTVGSLPRVSVVLSPGRYEVSVEDPDYVPRVATVEIVDGATFELKVILRKQVKVSGGLDPKQTIGLVVAGVGVAAGVVGGVLLASANGKAGQIDDLNADLDHLRSLPNGYSDYVAEYNDLKSDKELAEVGGWIGIGLGGAAIVTGVVLVLTGHSGPPTTEGSVHVGLGPPGAPGGMSIGFGF